MNKAAPAGFNQNQMFLTSHATARALPIILLLLMVGPTGGCQSYRAKPLTAAAVDKSLRTPAWQTLKKRAAHFAKIAVGSLRLQPRHGLLPAEAAIIAVLANPNLRAMRDMRGEASAQLMQAGILPNPQLSESTDFVTGGFRTDTFTAYGLSLNWNLTRLIDRQARMAAARYHRGQIDLEIAWREWQVAMAARIAVYNLAVAMKQKRQALLAAAELAKGYAVARKAYHARLTTVLEYNAARAATRQANDLILKLNQTMALQKLALARVMDVPPRTPISISARLTLPSHVSLPPQPVLVADMERYRPDLLALQLGYKSQEQRLRAAILRQFPNISIGFQQASDNTNVHTTGFGVTVDIPIFDRNQGNIAIQKATRRELFDSYISRVFKGRSDVAIAVTNVHDLTARIAALEKSVNSLETLVRRYRQALRLGNTDVVTYYTLIGQLVDRRIRLIALKGRLEQNLLALELASGQFLKQRAKNAAPSKVRHRSPHS